MIWTSRMLCPPVKIAYPKPPSWWYGWRCQTLLTSQVSPKLQYAQHPLHLSNHCGCRLKQFLLNEMTGRQTDEQECWHRLSISRSRRIGFCAELIIELPWPYSEVWKCRAKSSALCWKVIFSCGCRIHRTFNHKDLTFEQVSTALDQ